MATTSVASTITSTELLGRQAGGRDYVGIENSDANTLYLLFGDGTASAANYTVSLASGDYFEVPYPARGMALNGVWAADGTGAALITTI